MKQILHRLTRGPTGGPCRGTPEGGRPGLRRWFNRRRFPEERFDFDALTREVAGGLSRRQALRRIGSGVATSVLTTLGVVELAWAAPRACNEFCSQKQFAGTARQQCLDACRACGENPHDLCGPPGGLVCRDLQNDPSNCGACGNVCPSGSNSRAVCTSGVCGLACDAGYSSCDGIANTGCETPLLTDVHNCGGCGNDCLSADHQVANATMFCNNGACDFVCTPPYGNCDRIAANGCETDLSTDPFHCGACCYACSFPNGMAGCRAGACILTGCRSGWGNCDGSDGNGCETDLLTSASHCGACGNACRSGETCVNGRCTCGSIGLCVGEDVICCSGVCSNVSADVNNCGGCGIQCNAPANATVFCSSGLCGYTCLAPYADCNRNFVDGCETNLSTDVDNCGGCGYRCAFAHGLAACSAGTCELVGCETGWASCDGIDGNGCETDLLTSNSHCGACGNRCSAGETCSAGACRCGTGPRCGTGQICSSGICCPTSQTNCGGTCRDLNSDLANCGTCGNACQPTGDTCASGNCLCGTGPVCSGGMTCCSSTCVDTTSNQQHCGACGNDCDLIDPCSRLNPNCRRYTCCNGACVETATDPMNCGSCGNVCVGSPCTAGRCCQPVGAGCSDPGECCTHLCASGICACIPPQNTCASDVDCCNGLPCSDGKCCIPRLSNQECSSNSDCCAGSTCQFPPEGGHNRCL